MVSGTAALVLNKFPNLTVAQLVARLKRTGMRLSSLTGMVNSGVMIDAYAALTDVGSFTRFNATSVPGTTTLTWDPVPSATRYEIEVDGAVAASRTSPRFVHSGLAVGSAHFYRIRAIVGGNAGLWSQRWMKRAVQDPVLEILSSPVESAHPYDNNVDEIQSFSRSNATRVRIHFTQILTQGDFDVGDNNDYVSYCHSFEPGCDPESVDNRLFGSYPAFWTHFSDTAFRFAFHSDASVRAFGYRVDRIEYFTE
jgi:hypothetical protein